MTKPLKHKKTYPQVRGAADRPHMLTNPEYVRRVRQIIAFFTKKYPPPKLVEDYLSHKSEELQFWVVEKFKGEFYYPTGLSIIEAACLIARSQLENGYEVKGDDLYG